MGKASPAEVARRSQQSFVVGAALSCASFGALMEGIFPLLVPSLERRYHASALASAAVAGVPRCVIMLVYPLANFVAPVTLKKPERWLAAGALVAAAGCGVMALSNFTLDASYAGPARSFPAREVCDGDASGAEAWLEDGGAAQSAYGLLLLGSSLVGIGFVPIVAMLASFSIPRFPQVRIWHTAVASFHAGAGLGAALTLVALLFSVDLRAPSGDFRRIGAIYIPIIACGAALCAAFLSFCRVFPSRETMTVAGAAVAEQDPDLRAGRRGVDRRLNLFSCGGHVTTSALRLDGPSVHAGQVVIMRGGRSAHVLAALHDYASRLGHFLRRDPRLHLSLFVLCASEGFTDVAFLMAFKFLSLLANGASPAIVVLAVLPGSLWGRLELAHPRLADKAFRLFVLQLIGLFFLLVALVFVELRGACGAADVSAPPVSVAGACGCTPLGPYAPASALSNPPSAVCAQDGRTYASGCAIGCTSIGEDEVNTFGGCSAAVGGVAALGACDGGGDECGAGEKEAYEAFLLLACGLATCAFVAAKWTRKLCVELVGRRGAGYRAVSYGIFEHHAKLLGFLPALFCLPVLLDNSCEADRRGEDPAPLPEGCVAYRFHSLRDAFIGFTLSFAAISALAAFAFFAAAAIATDGAEGEDRRPSWIRESAASRGDAYERTRVFLINRIREASRATSGLSYSLDDTRPEVLVIPEEDMERRLRRAELAELGCLERLTLSVMDACLCSCCVRDVDSSDDLAGGGCCASCLGGGSAEARSRRRRGSLTREMVLNFVRRELHELAYSPRELEQLTRLFEAKAGGREGALTFKEFSEIVHLDLLGPGRTRKDVMRQFFRHIDGNRDGVIDLREFLLGFSYWREVLSQRADKYLFFFEIFDADHDGLLDVDEFAEVITHILAVEKNHAIKTHRNLAAIATLERKSLDSSVQRQEEETSIAAFAKAAFRAADVDRDGVLTLSELQTFISTVFGAGERQPFSDLEELRKVSFRLHEAQSAIHGRRLEVAGPSAPPGHDEEADFEILREGLRLLFDDDGRVFSDAVESLFLLYDRDDDATLSEEEFTRMIDRAFHLEAIVDDRLRSEAAQIAADIFAQVDIDGSGKLDLYEFKRWVQRKADMDLRASEFRQSEALSDGVRSSEESKRPSRSVRDVVVIEQAIISVDSHEF